jgi:hypothetical protein
MKLKDSREYYYYYSGKTSDIVRQLGFAGIGVIWLFKYEGQDHLLPDELLTVGFLIVLSLALDLLQYVVGTAVWGIFNRLKEKAGKTEDAEFTAPPAINWATIILFWGKVGVMGIAYVALIGFLVRKVT